MADVKISDLSILTSPASTDIVPVVSDPSGTPATKRASLDAVLETKTIYSIQGADTALTAGTSAQNSFAATGDVITLEATTTYRFEGMYFIDKSGSTTTIAMSFALGGGASITSIKYIALCQNIAKNTTGSTHGSVWVDQVAATVVNATATTAAYIKFEGLIRMNAGGTVTPQITFSAAPTSPQMLANSYILFRKLGTNTGNTHGAVA